MSYAGLLINTCDVVRKTQDQYGRLTGEVVASGVKCRWMYGMKRVLDDRGEEAMATAKVFFLPTVTLDTNYFLRYNGTEYKIIKILRPQDSTALHHVEVYVV